MWASGSTACVSEMQAFESLMTSFSNMVRGQVASNRLTTRYRGHDLDLSYITPRFVGMAFPAQGLSATWRNDVNVICDFLSERHGDNWHVWNLDINIYSASLLKERVTHCGWPDHHVSEGCERARAASAALTCAPGAAADAAVYHSGANQRVSRRQRQERSR